MHKAFYRIFAMAITIILVFCLCAPCFAAAPAMTAAEELMALWSMYCESVGFSQSFTTNGKYNTISNPFDSTIASSNMTTLYTEYAAIANRVEDLQTTVNWIKSNTEIAISNQQTGAFQFSAGVTEFFDKFSTWVLEDVVGVVKDSTTGLFKSSGSWFRNVLFNSQPSSFPEMNVTTNVYSDIVDNGLYLGNFSGRTKYVGSSQSGVYVFFIGSGTNLTAQAFSAENTSQLYLGYWNSVYTTTSWGLYPDSDVYFVTTYQGNISATPNYDIPIYNTVADAFEAFTTSDAGKVMIQVRPKDKYNEDALGIPDVDATDYIGTRVQEGVTNVPYDEIDAASSADILENLLAKVKALVLSNSGVLSDVSYGTVEPVISPLAPFDLPSFNFNFSGIWHYVVSWIGSIRSGSSFIFSVWNNIPFAMTIPIYATAVVCIVVGVFRKVF